MSLVLNTNSNGGGYEVSNTNSIGSASYPDFNQILMKPSFPLESQYGLEVQSGDNIPSRYEALSVNGTLINFWSSDIIMPICFQGNGAGGGYGLPGRIHSSTTGLGGLYRVGVKQQLQGGEIIGKLIRGAVHYASHTTSAGDITATIRVGLLHTDGSISYCGETISMTVSISTSGSLGTKFYSQSNSGIVSQAGDYVIADIGFNCSGRYATIDFGMEGGPNPRATSNGNDGVPFPIEISIE